MDKVRINRTLLSIISLIGNSFFLIYEFFNIILLQCFIIAISGILTLILGASGQDFLPIVGMTIGMGFICLIIGMVFIILYICSLISPFINKITSKKTIIFSVIKTCFMAILCGIYCILFKAENHEYILVIILINFIEMCYNLSLLYKNNKKSINGK